MQLTVLKFGGTSVSSAPRWATIARVVAARRDEGLRPVVVCSALSGVSNQLSAAVDAVAAGTCDPDAVVAAIREIHRSLAVELGVDPGVCDGELEALSRVLRGATLLGEAGPKVRARVMATGELLSTRLGAAFLASQGLDVPWVDARELLLADPSGGEARHWLSATCDFTRDPASIARFSAPADGFVTQGFIARDADGATVLLGRGGSDTSAAYLAAKLDAVACEIWTDVPGMFSANPRLVAGARLLRTLEVDEAQEIAAAGAKVLHPRCLAPVKVARIPLLVKCTDHPDLEGTLVTADAPPGPAQVKAIAVRTGLVLVSLETLGMWQQVGFLADAFAAFKALDLSIDLVSTSETNVTVTLDPSANAVDPPTLARLEVALRRVCTPRVVHGVASISLVGRGIRGILHQLAPVLRLFEEQRVHLVSQAANDLNLTLVVDENQVDRLVRELHGQLFAGKARDAVLGPTWTELFAPAPQAPQKKRLRRDLPWWHHDRDRLLSLETPRFVLHGPTLERAAAQIRELSSVERVFYAVKANPHPGILARFAAAGLGFECVSPGELAAVAHLAPERVLFTPNFAPREEVADALGRGYHFTLDNLHPVERWPELFRGVDLQLRLDPGRGRGHHAHVRTAGATSKFGVSADQLPAVRDAVHAAGARVVGLHAHVGSGIRDAGTWAETASFLAEAAELFPDVTSLDLGGGLGVPARPGQRPLDLAALDLALSRVRAAWPRLSLWLEPGRWLVAEAGVLLARVTQLKWKGDVAYVGVDTGMNSLIRPALYGAHHEIVNLSRLEEPPEILANVVGPICESGDTLGFSRRLPATSEGDVLLIATTGAYGRAMSSRYNLREPAEEIVLD
jgi:diaminopimelate decarboxylase/aspartate kinase